LDHNQPSNKSDQSTIMILTTVDAMGSTDVDQSGTKRVLSRVSVEVVSKQTSRGQISDEENEVEEGSNYLCGAIEEEDSEDGEGGEGNGENGKDFRSDNLPRNPTETKVAKLVHHITQCADEDDSEQELEEPDPPSDGSCYSSCDHLDKVCFPGSYGIWEKGSLG